MTIVNILGRNIWLGCALTLFALSGASMSSNGLGYQPGWAWTNALLALVLFVAAVVICKLIRDGRMADEDEGAAPVERCAEIALFCGGGMMAAALWMPQMLGLGAGFALLIACDAVMVGVALLACAKNVRLPAWTRLSGVKSGGAVFAPLWARAIAVSTPIGGAAVGLGIPLLAG